MAQNESFDLSGPAGRLEALIMHPEAAPVGVAIVCHAHPLHGGMMHFRVVFRAAKALQACGFSVLRFNFRGVGRSEGIHDHGRGEVEDARAAADEASSRHPGLPLVVGGFSFGAAVALRLASSDARVRAAFALGLPESMVADTASLAQRRIPRLLVQGEVDEFADTERIRHLAFAFDPQALLRIVPQADHFFTGRLDAVDEALRAWAAGRPWTDQP